MGWKSLFADNPLLIKHVRSRMRRQPLILSIASVVILCLLIVWAASAARSPDEDLGMEWLLFLQGMILFVGGTAQVAAATGQARESGNMDFHRISPQRPFALSLGFILGAPVREWILFACTLPFALVFVAQGYPRPGAYVQILAAFLSAALLYHTLGAFVGMVISKARNASGTAVAIVLLYNMFTLGEWLAAFTIGPTCMQTLKLGGATDLPTACNFYGANLPAFLIALIHQIPLAVFLCIAVNRKMCAERAALFARPTAILFQVFIGLLTLGDIWDLTIIELPRFALTLIAYTLMTAGVLLSSAVTPASGDFANVVRRANRLGRAHPAAWSDMASNRALLLALAVVTVGCVVFAARCPAIQQDPTLAVLGASLTAAGAILFYGSARQYFGFRFRENGIWYFGFCLFCIWILPLLIGILVGSNHYSDWPQGIMGISPLAGIVIAASWRESGADNVGMLSAVISSFVLALGFWILSTRAECAAAAEAIAAWKGRDRRTTAVRGNYEV